MADKLTDFSNASSACNNYVFLIHFFVDAKNYSDRYLDLLLATGNKFYMFILYPLKL